jgi:flagellar protein FlgJ
MRPSDITAANRAGTLWNTAQPVEAQGGAGAFDAVFRQVHDEVRQVIEHGWPGDGAAALSLEGQARRAALPAASASAAAQGGPGTADAVQQEFLAMVAPWAKEAGERLGVAPGIVAAHAALESGWGQRPLRDAAGQDTHNLFGIKAQRGFTGSSADSLTTEYEDGVALKKTERFRSYPDHASAFRDYARLLQDNPRYRDALQAGSDASAFAQGLARGGYATDPDYAAKLTRLASKLQSLD